MHHKRIGLAAVIASRYQHKCYSSSVALPKDDARPSFLRRAWFPLNRALPERASRFFVPPSSPELCDTQDGIVIHDPKKKWGDDSVTIPCLWRGIRHTSCGCEKSGMSILTSITAALGVFAATAFAAGEIVVSVAEQKLYVMENGERRASFPVSTSKFGIGSTSRSYRTPLGGLVVSEKVGAGAPIGAVFKGLQPTGEVLRPNAPGRDPIVTRVICLDGIEKQNRNAASRRIYIHGTPEERKIGRPASYGCIRMKSRDVARLFDRVNIGTHVTISPLPLSRLALQAK